MLNSEENELHVKEEEMPRKKTKVSSYKRRKPSGARKTVSVRGYSRGAKKITIKYPKRKTRKK